MTLKPQLILIALLFLSGTASHAETTEPAEVLLFGTFHFKDAGLDVVQVEDVDIFSEENQAYLEQLTDRLAAFQPTAVLLEYNPENEDSMNERYRQYVEGTFELPANEVFQLGFRIARKAGLERVYSFDHREVHWEAQPLLSYTQASEPAQWETFQETIKNIEREEKEVRAELSLAQLLARQNDAERDRLNRDLYISMNVIGVDDNWVGANATASWWERNFRMYARLQHHAVPGSRIIAIGGSGHMAILNQLLATDSKRQAEPPQPYIMASDTP